MVIDFIDDQKSEESELKNWGVPDQQLLEQKFPELKNLMQKRYDEPHNYQYLYNSYSIDSSEVFPEDSIANY